MEKFIPLLLLTLPSLSIAVNYMCPTNSQYVATGDSIGKVMLTCGQPSKVIEGEDSDTTQQVTVLAYRQSSYQGGKMLADKLRYYQVNIAIAKNNVVNIQVNGQNLSTTSLCQHSAIKVGDPVQRVYSLCGRPFLMTQTSMRVPETKPAQLIYQVNDYTSPVVFIFKQGKLADRQ